MSTVGSKFAVGLPDAMPVLGYADGYATPRPKDAARSTPASDHPPIGIGASVARVLLALTLEVEDGAEVSLATASCLLRVIPQEPLAVKELPVRAGVVKEAIDPAIKWLGKREYVAIAGAGAKSTVCLTPKGVQTLEDTASRVASVEQRWQNELDNEVVGALHAALESLFDVRGSGPLIAEGLVPPDGGWRGTKPYLAQTNARLMDPRSALPHHPMLTHRGGWPDGA